MNDQHLDHAANAGRHCLADRRHDLYETPAEAVHALLRVESLPQRIWEPACGPGAIVQVLRGAGHDVIATDLNDWGCPDSGSGIDFLMERQAPDGVEAIITNPPYKLADAFVAHALDLAPRVCMLLRLTFLESERRTPILESGRLARVHVFRNRLAMMHRHGWTGPKASSSIASAADQQRSIASQHQSRRGNDGNAVCERDQQHAGARRGQEDLAPFRLRADWLHG